MKIISILAFLLAYSAQAESVFSTVGTVKRIKHGTTNISSTAYTQIFGTVSWPVKYISISNSSLSGTLVLAIGCTGNAQTNVLFVQAGVSDTFPLALGKGDCLSVAAADGTISTGNSTYSIYIAE